MAAGRFAVVTSAGPTATQRADVERRGAVLVVAEPGDDLHEWLRRGRAGVAVVRPDGAVLRAGRDLSVLCAAVPDPPGRRG